MAYGDDYMSDIENNPNELANGIIGLPLIEYCKHRFTQFLFF